MQDPPPDRPIEDMVREAVVKHGVDAGVTTRDRGLELLVPGQDPLWIEAGTDLDQWGLLPQNLRERKAHALAARLVHLHKNRGEAESQGPSLPPMGRLVPLAIGLGIGMIMLFTVQAVRRRQTPPPAASATPGSESDPQRAARLSRACEATRVAFWTGAPWGAMPLEGFVVRLWLGPKDGAKVTHPLLDAAAKGERVSPDVDGTLADVSDGRMGSLEIAGENETGIAFFEGYARAFFEMDKRERFIALGERLVRETKADWAALEAGCAHLGTRDAGAWFDGKDDKNAAFALLHTMGLPRGPKSTTFAPAAKDAAALRTLIETNADDLLEITRDQGARTTSNERTTIAFPYANPGRATIASGKVAEKLGLR